MIILPKYELSCIYAIADAIKQLPPEEIKIIQPSDNMSEFINLVLFGHLQIIIKRGPFANIVDTGVIEDYGNFLYLFTRLTDTNGDELPTLKKVTKVWQPSLDPDVKAKLVEFPVINLDAKFELLFTKYSGAPKIENQNDILSCNIDAVSYNQIKTLISDTAEKVGVVRKETQRHIDLYKLKQQLDNDALIALYELTKIVNDKIQKPV